MHTLSRICSLTILVALAAASTALAAPGASPAWFAPSSGTDADRDNEKLKLAALEGLMSAPSDRALPLIRKVLAGNDSDNVKSRALFVLGQMGSPEARSLLIELAKNEGSMLQPAAIRAIGIGGSAEALAELADIYRRGNASVKESVLNAYLIAGDPAPVYAIARDATDDETFAQAVRILGAMGAKKELALLVDKGANSAGLVQAYAMAGDLDSLKRLATGSADAGQRTQAIRNIGIVGGEAAGTTLVDIYQSSSDEANRDAALQGLLIGGYDQSVLTLFRASQDPADKRKLLRTLVTMNSDLALQVIDEALGND